MTTEEIHELLTDVWTTMQVLAEDAEEAGYFERAQDAIILAKKLRQVIPQIKSVV